MEEARIEDLIHQYEESIRNRRKLFDYNFSKQLLSVLPTFISNQEAIEAQIYEKTKECEQLKEGLGKPHDKIAKLYSKYEDLIKHYELLLKNNHVEKFLDFAIFLKTRYESNENTNATLKSKNDDLFRCYEGLLKDHTSKELTEEDIEYQSEDPKFQLEELKLQFEERNDESRRLKSNLDEADEKLSSKDSELKKVHELLSEENLQRKQVESERDNLSEKLRNLMLEYQQCVCRFDKITETNSQICCDNSTSSIIESDSDLVLRIDTSTSEDDLDEINFSGEDGYCELLTSPSGSYRDWNKSAENIDSNDSLPKKDQRVSNKPDENSSISACSLVNEGNNVITNLSPSVSFESSEKIVKTTSSQISIKHIGIKAKSMTNELPISAIPQDQSKFDCDIGERPFMKELGTVEEMSSSMDTKTNRLFQSEKCGESFEEKNKRQKLMKLSTCDVQNCNTRGEKRTNLEKNHKFADTGTDDIPNQKECQSSDFYCNICDKHYSCKNSLNAHKRSVHRGEKPYKCNECGKKFIGKSHLKDHILTHGSLKPFKCSVCGKCFNHLSNKKKHERTIHEGEARFQCAYCNKRCTFKTNLIRHIHVHHFPVLQKRFKCTVCDKAFTEKWNLNSHKLVHTSQKHLKCSICDEHFKYIQDRKVHEKKFHNDEINFFRFVHCDKMYSNVQNLSHHLQKKHAQ